MSDPLSRRLLMKLSLLSVFPLAGRCAESLPEARSLAGRIHARPDLDGASALRLPDAGGGPERLRLGGRRDGYVYAPADRPSGPLPLIVFLHGAGGSGQPVIQRLRPHADRMGSVVLAPDSRRETWSVVTGNDAEDAAFLDGALEAAFESYPIDAARVGIAGFSDGASAALSFGIANGGLFSAIAAFSPGFIRLPAPPQGRPRIFISHGASDPVLPVDRCGRKIARILKGSGYTVNYREFDGGHTVPEEIVGEGLEWVARG